MSKANLAGRVLRCLACGTILDTVRSYCDQQCESYTQAHGPGGYRARPWRDRGYPEATRVRPDYRRHQPK